MACSPPARRAALLAAALLCSPALAQSGWPPVRERLGGATTIRDAGANAFGFPASVLDRHQRRRFVVGNSFFRQNWIESPATATSRDGLGPLFVARSCSACHHKDGRSAPPEAGDADRHGLLMRIGVRRPNGPDAPHPRYGAQIQDRAVQGVPAEARVVIRYQEIHGRYHDGTRWSLLRPAYDLEALAYGDLGPRATLGPRTAPQLIGLGLLEAVPVAELARRADPGDANGDGISGRVHYRDAERTVAGRFGWKATEPTVRSQVAAAFANDMGITSPDVPGSDLPPHQQALVGERDEPGPEIRARTFDDVVFYTQALAVPAQRDAHAPEVRRGQALFHAFGCADCHVPTLTTGNAAFVDAYADHRFHPYTDLLLHDMGEGLADGKHDGDAAPREWRTPPLWGVGLLDAVNGHTRLLHDGRARGVEEAVLWHGGEARIARECFVRAPAADRAALLRFVRSL
ncbi:MAG: thiol oxidoreductase [Planctomycetes bacterium]|nr:thiol oxidoreductase [Planctomycetota bacterium]